MPALNADMDAFDQLKQSLGAAMPEILGRGKRKKAPSTRLLELDKENTDKTASKKRKITNAPTGDSEKSKSKSKSRTKHGAKKNTKPGPDRRPEHGQGTDGPGSLAMSKESSQSTYSPATWTPSQAMTPMPAPTPTPAPTSPAMPPVDYRAFRNHIMNSGGRNTDQDTQDAGSAGDRRSSSLFSAAPFVEHNRENQALSYGLGVSSTRDPHLSLPLPSVVVAGRPVIGSQSLATATGTSSEPMECDDSEDSDTAQTTTNNASAKKTKKKLTLEDLDDTPRALTEEAIVEYRVWLSTVDAYPAEARAKQAATNLLHEICVENQFLPKDRNTLKEMIKLIVARGSELRGKLKDQVRILIAPAYGLSTKTTKKAIKNNREMWETLTSKRAYVFRDPSKRILAYDHPILQETINMFWFESPADVGIRFSDYFNPITKDTIALIFTAVEFCLNEWRTGAIVRKKSEKKRGQASGPTFNAVEWEPVYRRHLMNLEHIEKRSPANADALRKLCEHLYLRARRHSGVSATEDAPTLDDDDCDNFATHMDERANTDSEDDDISDGTSSTHHAHQTPFHPHRMTHIARSDDDHDLQDTNVYNSMEDHGEREEREDQDANKGDNDTSDDDDVSDNDSDNEEDGDGIM